MPILWREHHDRTRFQLGIGEKQMLSCCGIRTIAKSELTGSEGKFMWDGTDDDNQRARVGIYIVFVEVYNLQGKVKRFKKQVVLGAKLN